MLQDHLPAPTGAHPEAAHPPWCDPRFCTVTTGWPHGLHHSAPRSVDGDPPSHTTIRLVLLAPDPADPAHPGAAGPIATIELDGADGDEPALCPLTHGQVRALHGALGALLSAWAGDPARPA